MDVSTTEEKTNVTAIDVDKNAEDTKAIEEKIGAIKQLVSVHDLVMRGKHEGFLHQRVSDAATFINSLHKSLMDEIHDHPNKELAKSILDKHLGGSNEQPN